MLEELFITLPEGIPAPEVVQEHIVKHSHSKPKRRKDPTWAVVCIILGAFLSIGTGAFLITLGATQ